MTKQGREYAGKSLDQDSSGQNSPVQGSFARGSFAQDLIDEAPDALVALSLDGRILAWNRGAETIFGYVAAEAVGKPIDELVVPDDRRAEARQALADVIESGTVLFETIRRRKDGALIDIDSTMRLVKSPAGQPSFIAVSKKDVTQLVTERKRAAEIMAEAKDAAETASRELEAFSYSVAHDLRAPLRGIDGFSLALLEDHSAQLDAEGKEFLRRVRESTQFMAQLIDSLLLLAQVTQSELRRERVDLSRLAAGAVARLQSAQPERQTEVIIADGLFTHGDERLLGIALDNLIGNAWKFTDRRPKSRIAFGRGEDGGQPAYFVSDDGAGFDMAYAAKLFGVFQRLHTPDEFEGTGIGLATVERIVRRHGGRIWARGEVNRGATFYFTLDDRELGT
jgi:PAS domain S-box-containing protein